MKEKIALFCDVDADAVIENRTASTIYEVPLMMQQEGLDRIVLEKMAMDFDPSNMEAWEKMVFKINHPAKRVKIAVVGKYVALPDAYMSVTEALHHGGIENDAQVKIAWINAEALEDRGVEGKIRAIQYAREKGIPFLGLCLGMQCAVIEFARNVAGLSGAHSTEFVPETPHPVIALMEDQHDVEEKGGTMRLGAYPCTLREPSLSRTEYGSAEISERHRHRFEFNNAYRAQLEERGMRIAGTSPDNRLVEVVEIADHPWFVASQFHPELKSRPNHPHPLFAGFVRAALAAAPK